MKKLPENDLLTNGRCQGDAVLAAVQGEIDLHNSPDLRSVLLEIIRERSPKRLILNFAKVPYMDSSGLAVLVESMQKLRKIGGRLFLCGLQERVRGILEIARLDTVFVLVKDETEALAQ